MLRDLMIAELEEISSDSLNLEELKKLSDKELFDTFYDAVLNEGKLLGVSWSTPHY